MNGENYSSCDKQRETKQFLTQCIDSNWQNLQERIQIISQYGGSNDENWYRTENGKEASRKN